MPQPLSPVTSSSLRLRTLLALGLSPLGLAGCGTADTECLLPASDTAECPTQAEAQAQLIGDHCGYSVNSVTGEGSKETVENSWDTGSAGTVECCYPTLETTDTVTTCMVGRPYLDADGLKTAPARRAKGWARGVRPDVRRLSPTERTVLATAWAEDALVEHASVAAFARTTLELLAVGAPADLVAAVQAAAADEVRHAQRSFALAEAYAGGPISPGAFPFAPTLRVETDLAALAAATFREGCVGETVVALLSARAATEATDLAAKGLLTLVSVDEARHAELAWRTLGWMLSVGGASAREAVEREVAALIRNGVRLTQITTGAAHSVLAAHGRIRPGAALSARNEAIEAVILPCVEALLASVTTAADQADCCKLGTTHPTLPSLTLH